MTGGPGGSIFGSIRISFKAVLHLMKDVTAITIFHSWYSSFSGKLSIGDFLSILLSYYENKLRSWLDKKLNNLSKTSGNTWRENEVSKNTAEKNDAMENRDYTNLANSVTHQARFCFWSDFSVVLGASVRTYGRPPWVNLMTTYSAGSWWAKNGI